MSDLTSSKSGVNGIVEKNQPKEWVKFDEETAEANPSPGPGLAGTSSAVSPKEQRPAAAPAVLNTETVQISLDRGDKSIDLSAHSNNLSRNSEYVNIRQGFSKYLHVFDCCCSNHPK